MRVWIFSDLHLTHPESSLFQSFLKVLEEPSSAQDHVVFAGDIFDLLVGNSAFFQAKYQTFFNAVSRLAAQDVKLYYIEGNHDFHLERLFGEVPIRFESECVVIDLPAAGSTPATTKKLFIAHGDLVDQGDRGYLQLRKFFRSKTVRALAQWVPGTLIHYAGNLLSRPLPQKQAELPEHWSRPKRERLRKVFREYAEEKHRQGFDYIVLGHCHDLDEVAPFYWNMGYPPAHRQFLFYDATKDSLARRNFPGFSGGN